MKKILLSLVLLLSFASANVREVVNFSPEFLMKVSMGQVAGASFVHKFGENPDVDTGTVPEDMTDIGGTITVSAVADINNLSSSSASDTVVLTVYGLNANWDVVEQTITLNGQNKVTLNTSVMIPYRMVNSNGTDLIGDVYWYKEGAAISSGVPSDLSNVKAKIALANGKSNNQTMMAWYPVPRNHTGFLLSWRAAVSRRTSTVADIHGEALPFNGVWQVKEAFSLSTTGTTTDQDIYPIPRRFPEKSIMKFVVTDVTANDSGLSGSFGILLLNNDVWRL